jgi:hypothetical protein
MLFRTYSVFNYRLMIKRYKYSWIVGIECRQTVDCTENIHTMQLAQRPRLGRKMYNRLA